MRSVFQSKSLTRQMIINFIMIVIITAIIAGLPGILILRNEHNKHAWTQVEQGAYNMKTLYTARQNELIAFAKLVGHRSCLQATVMAGDTQAALEHLADLISGTEVSLVVLCDNDDKIITSTLDLPVEDMCLNDSERGFVLLPGEGSQNVWVFGSHYLGDHASGLGRVIAGIPANDALADAVHLQSGLEYSILQGRIPIITSLGTNPDELNAAFASIPSFGTIPESFQRKFSLDSESYYAVNQILEDSPDLRYEVAISVEDIVATQTQFLLLLVGGILIVIVFGSLAGIVLARRISRPLEQLANTAVTFSSGDLSAPVQVQADVREVVLVSKALEDARVKLLDVMTELSDEKAWTNHLLESITEGIVTLDDQNRITFFSRGAERMTGLDREQVRGQSCDDVFKLPEANAQFSQIIPSNGKESRVIVELDDQRWVTFSFTGALLSKAGAAETETALVFRDVSDEEVIHRRLGYFIANITHEFRTPLSALAASIELLLDQAHDITAEDLEHLLGSLHLSVLRLQTMIDNLIESASISAGHFRVSPRATELEKIITDTVSLMTPLFQRYGQRLVVQMSEHLPPVIADSKRTMQVLVNLLSNAHKFSPADADICIRAEAGNGFIRVQVTDKGPGIPPDQRAYLFHRLNRLNLLANSAKAGAGLGLPVVKAIVEAQGGQIGVEDTPGGGAQFWFTMKVAGEG
jgi:PAS domain S-box-containing protein